MKKIKMHVEYKKKIYIYINILSETKYKTGNLTFLLPTQSTAYQLQAYNWQQTLSTLFCYLYLSKYMY